jgi:hypothetical protein
MSYCPCRQYNNKDVIKCTNCEKTQHKDCVKDLIKMINYECPSCQIKVSDPFIKHIVNILTPTLIPCNNFLKSTFEVGEEVNKVLKSNMMPNSNSKFFILRCLRLDSEGYEHHWPFNCSISINGTLMKTMTYPKEVNRSQSRKDFPLVFYLREEDYTQNYHKFQQNHMYKFIEILDFNRPNSIELKNDLAKNPKDIWRYVISIDLVEVIKEVEEVLGRIPIYKEESLKKRQVYLSQFRNGMNITGEQISFLENYTSSGKRITLPGRSLNCHHLNAFDLKNFLLLRRNKSYDCPFCKCKATRLYVDDVLRNLIQVHADCDGVKLNSDYTVSDLIKRISPIAETPIKINKKETMVDLTSDSTPQVSVSIKKEINETMSNTISLGNRISKQPIVIDLIEEEKMDASKEKDKYQNNMQILFSKTEANRNINILPNLNNISYSTCMMTSQNDSCIFK